MENQDHAFSHAYLLKQIKARVLLTQRKATYTASEEMLPMYWNIGKLLSKSQEQIGWGNNALEKLANDLKSDYPGIRGFFIRDCQFMIQSYNEYNQQFANTKRAVLYLNNNEIVLPISKLSWSHNIALMQHTKDIKARYWYMIQCLKNGWSRGFLIEVIKQDYYHSHGALVSNFGTTLLEIQARQVKETLKDPYTFDMFTFTEGYDGRDIGLGLIKRIERFSVEMGVGFAFMGRRYYIGVSEKDFYTNILIYNVFVRRYLVVELKRGEFQPKYIDKLNSYRSAVDNILCRGGDNPTIGLLLCQNKDQIMARYALWDVHKPIGVSDYELGRALPKDTKSGLSSIEELENKLSRDLQDINDKE